MDENIVSICNGKSLEPVQAPEVNMATIEILERALQDARAGVLKNVLVLGKNADGSWSTGMSIPPSGNAFCSHLEFVGALERTKAEIFTNVNHENISA